MPGTRPQNNAHDRNGGVTAAGTLRLEDSHGDKISQQDFDLQPFIGVFLKVRF